MSGSTERDEVSGRSTTGHAWDGIKELNTPLPSWWLYVLYATIVWAFGYWIVYPAWPMVSDYTRGLFGYSSRADVTQQLQEAAAARAAQTEQLTKLSVEQISADPQLLNYAIAGGRSVFAVNCAPCHGAGGQGGHDLLMSSGGVSSGEEDHVKAAVEALGRLHFWRLAIKPGRPIAMGQVDAEGRRVPFMGLPGNPVAAMVTFLRLARPLILRMMGARDLAPTFFRVRADFEHKKKRDRREWVRARLITDAAGVLVAHKFPRDGAGILSSLVQSDGLVELPEDITQLAAGSMVDFLPFSELR